MPNFRMAPVVESWRVGITFRVEVFMKAQWEELAAMVLIGDGILNVVHPRRHSAIWNCGPASYRQVASKLQSRPQVAREEGRHAL